MPYLYGRTKGLVDLLVEKDPRTKVQIKVGAYLEGTSYSVVVNGRVFTYEVPSSAENLSPNIVTQLKSMIEGEGDALGCLVLDSGDSLYIYPEVLNGYCDVSAHTQSQGEVIVSQVFPLKMQVLADLGSGPETIATFSIEGGKSKSLPYDPLAGSGTNFRPWTRYRFNPTDLGLDDLNDIEIQIAYEFLGTTEFRSDPFNIPPKPLWMP